MECIAVTIRKKADPREGSELLVYLADHRRMLHFTLDRKTYRLSGLSCFSVLSQLEGVLRENGYTSPEWPPSPCPRPGTEAVRRAGGGHTAPACSRARQ